MKVLILTLCLGTLASANHHEIQVDGRSCNVTTYFTQNITGGQCRWYDEVMVGIKSVEPLIIRCARLQVSCTKSSQSPEETER